MARNRRRSRSSRSMSPDLWRDDDLEAQKSTVNSSNTETKQKAPSVVSTKRSAHRRADDVSPTTSFHGAQSSEIRSSGDLETQSVTRLVPVSGREDVLQATDPLRIPLPPSVESFTQREGYDSESASSGGAPSIAAEDKRHSFQETPDPWTRCAERVWAYNKNKVDKWGKEISEKLVLFAGLFSTVITGFLVPYYVSLQPDTSTQALVMISSQLVAISGQLRTLENDSLHLDVTQPNIPSVATLSPAQPTSHKTIVSICTLWFMALVCSLAAASIGMVVSQWLQDYDDVATSTSQQRVRMWYFRDRGFVEWGVLEIVYAVPLLLQISVMLFLAGLVQLLWTMNAVVAGVVTMLVAALFVFSIGTAVIPAFAPKCPYKSPQAWWFFLSLRWLTKHLEDLPFIYKRFGDVSHSLKWYIYLEGGGFAQEYLLRRLWHSFSLPLSLQSFRASMPTFSAWRDLEYYLVRLQAEEEKDRLKMMIHADEILTDETSLPEIISPCVTESDLDAALPAFHAIMQRRAHESKPSDDPDRPELIWYSVGSDGQLLIALGDMAVNMFARVTRVDREAELLCILKIVDKLLIAMPRTRTGAAIYVRVCALAYAENLSRDVWERLAELIVIYCSHFDDYIQDIHTDIRPNLLAISACQGVDLSTFLGSVAPVLHRSTKLPQAEFERIRDKLQEALAAIAHYFGGPDVVTLADHLTHDDDWNCFGSLSDACVELAKVNKGVFVPEVVDALERVASLCPIVDYLKEPVRNKLKTLRELTGLPSHPEENHAANASSRSASKKNP